MPIEINLSQLQAEDQVELVGTVPAEELEIDTMDTLIRPGETVEFDLYAEWMEKEIFVRGRIAMVFHCHCARCLKPFDLPIESTDWATLLPLDGEEKIKISGDSIDLSPMIREDFLLSLPQRPLCENGCEADRPTSGSPDEPNERPEPSSGPWEALDDLNFK